MPEAHKTVFISYRRKPARYIARAILQNLVANGYDVFMDVENIPAGDFGATIESEIRARMHFLVILTTGTVARFDEEKDWLRHEIEYAMAHQRNIVPLLIDGFKYDKRTRSYLTGKLAELMKLESVTIYHEYFDAGLEKLRARYLVDAVGVSIDTPAIRSPEVERSLEEAAAEPPPTEAELSAEDYFNMAMSLNDNSDDEIAYYTEAIRLNPQYAAAYNNRGIARYDSGDLNGAIADYTRSIELKNPELHLPYNNRGNARAENGDLNGAIADYNEANRIAPQFDGAYYNRGNVRAENGDLNGAIADYNEAIRLNPQYAEAYISRGSAHRAQGDLIGAIADYDEAIRLNPQYAPAYYNRGSARRVQGNLSGAIADYQKYLDLGGGRRDGDQDEVEQIIRYLQAQLGSQS